MGSRVLIRIENRDKFDYYRKLLAGAEDLKDAELGLLVSHWGEFFGNKIRHAFSYSLCI